MRLLNILLDFDAALEWDDVEDPPEAEEHLPARRPDRLVDVSPSS